MRGLWLILFAVVALSAPGRAVAAAGAVGRPLATCIARAAPALSARAAFANAGRFDCARDQRSFGPGDYQVLSAPIREGARRPAIVRAASVWQARATMDALYADGAIVRVGPDASVSRRIQLGAIVEYRLPVRGVAVERVLWTLEGVANMRGVVVGARVATPREAARSNTLLAALYAAFGGLCAALLLHNLALWGAMRHRFQLAYCAMVATLLVYAASSSGALAWLWPDLANNDRLRINYLALALSAASALAFARAYFEPRVFAGWVGRLAIGVQLALVGSAAAFAALAPWQARMLDQLYAASFALLLAIVPVVLWRGWRQRSDYLWLFALAWSAPVAFATLRVLANFGLIGWYFWLDNSTILAMAAEAIVSSLAVAYRIRLLGRDLDEARAGERIARTLADVDPLTGLLNRRAFLREVIGREGAQALLVVDVDHFKRVNETLGHDGGDEVLRRVTRALRVACPGALVARIGGEEFAIVADAACAPAPADVLARIRAERMPFDLPVTASIGVGAGALATEADWQVLYRAADRALFEAKAGGRDRARLAA